MKYIKTFEINNINYLKINDYFKNYVLYGEPNETLFLVKIEEVKEYSKSLIYVKFNVINIYKKLIQSKISTNVKLTPEWPIEDLKRNIKFQSDNIEEVENYIEMLKDQNKYNL